MKKIYIAMAVLATAALTSCEQEKSFNDEKLMDNALVFSLQGAPSTRSMETGATIEKGVTFELGTDEDGNSFFMEETIQDLNAAWAPATKGTPAYTENVGVLYEKMGVRAGSSNYEFYSMDNSEGTATGKMVDGGWRYQGEFTWAQDAYDFYFWMPTTGNGITGTPTYGTTGDDLSITFTYESPTTAADQKDLIFAARNITKTEALDNRVNGVPILFNHALTGVKFAIMNYDKTKKITITSVSFSGLYDKGTCTIIPAKENNYRDKPTEEYSSGDGRVSWPAANLTKSGNAIESGTFSEEGPVDFTGGSFANNGNYPDSFSAAGNKNNLNDADASQTFWLIPQTLTDAVTLTIHYTFGSDEDQTWVIDFGEIVAAKGDAVWKAGQLRTYTLKVDDINVHIADEISSSHIKQNIAITNTGNTDAFIRATIIGNWCSPDGAAVFGYTDFIDNPGEYVEIDSWTIDQTGGGSFVGLPTTTATTGWVRGNDGYFYYTTAIAPEATAPALFTSYTPGDAPAFQLAGKPVDAHFVMEIATQAISAKKPDASNYTWSEAWTNALGYNPSTN